MVVPSASLLSARPCITAFHKFGNLAFSQSNRVLVRAAFHVLGVAIPGLATYLLGIYGFAVTYRRARWIDSDSPQVAIWNCANPGAHCGMDLALD